MSHQPHHDKDRLVDREWHISARLCRCGAGQARPEQERMVDVPGISGRQYVAIPNYQVWVTMVGAVRPGGYVVMSAPSFNCRFK